MKKLLTVAWCLLSMVSYAQESEQDVKSTIKHVTVFLQGAEVTRHGLVTLKPGVTILTLRGVSPAIQEESIQVSGSSSVKIQSVSFRVNYLQPGQKPENLSTLQTERKRLLAFLAQEQSMRDVYVEEESILKTNKAIGGTSGIEIGQLKIAMDYFRQRLSDIKQQQLNVDRSIKNYEESLARVDAQLKELKSARVLPTGEITVKVSVETATQADLNVTYVINEARWFPSYDIRAKNIQSPVSITYKANVSQQSGEDWDNVALTISSANPTQFGARPLIQPWYLGFNNAISYRSELDDQLQGRVAGLSMSSNAVRGRVLDSDGNPLPGVNILLKGTTVGTVTDMQGNYSLALTGTSQTVVYSFIGYSSEERFVGNQPIVDVTMNADAMALSEVVVTGYGDNKRDSRPSAYAPEKKIIAATPVVRQTNIEFNIVEPFTIKSDGEMRTTDMVAYELEAMYEYYCAPKLETDVFLLAKIVAWDEYNFLDGEASLFFEGKYIGRSVMDTHNTSDTLSLSLGRDANVLVTREKVKDISSRQFVGNSQKALFAYDIVVRNKKALPLTIVIEDQLPVPNTKDITVDKLEDTAGDYNEATGIINWRKQILPGKAETIRLKYAIRYPKHSQIMLE